MGMNKDLVAASATPLVLAILSEGDSYGYAIIKRVNELSGSGIIPKSACANSWASVSSVQTDRLTYGRGGSSDVAPLMMRTWRSKRW